MPELEPGQRHSFSGFSFSFEAEESIGEGFFQSSSTTPAAPCRHGQSSTLPDTFREGSRPHVATVAAATAAAGGVAISAAVSDAAAASSQAMSPSPPVDSCRDRTPSPCRLVTESHDPAVENHNQDNAAAVTAATHGHQPTCVPPMHFALRASTSAPHPHATSQPQGSGGISAAPKGDRNSSSPEKRRNSMSGRPRNISPLWYPHATSAGSTAPGVAGEAAADAAVKRRASITLSPSPVAVSAPIGASPARSSSARALWHRRHHAHESAGAEAAGDRKPPGIDSADSPADSPSSSSPSTSARRFLRMLSSRAGLLSPSASSGRSPTRAPSADGSSADISSRSNSTPREGWGKLEAVGSFRRGSRGSARGSEEGGGASGAAAGGKGSGAGAGAGGLLSPLPKGRSRSPLSVVHYYHHSRDSHIHGRDADAPSHSYHNTLLSPRDASSVTAAAASAAAASSGGGGSTGANGGIHRGGKIPARGSMVSKSSPLSPPPSASAPSFSLARLMARSISNIERRSTSLNDAADAALAAASAAGIVVPGPPGRFGETAVTGEGGAGGGGEDGGAGDESSGDGDGDDGDGGAGGESGGLDERGLGAGGFRFSMRLRMNTEDDWGDDEGDAEGEEAEEEDEEGEGEGGRRGGDGAGRGRLDGSAAYEDDDELDVLGGDDECAWGGGNARRGRP
ncbi:unnamed protein product [Closterium sp. Yama58-4]|nr:unnamed protein product [Closterium sp. Yama58-4]